MKLRLLTFQQWLKLLEDRYNPPRVQSKKDDDLFQAKMRRLYNRLIERLSVFGEEGDYYGISDFSVGPDLRDRQTVKAPPAPQTSEFDITIITRKFYESDYLQVLHEFLSAEAQGYRIIIAKDFDPKWALRIALTADCAQVYCTNRGELARLRKILNALKASSLPRLKAKD